MADTAKFQFGVNTHCALNLSLDLIARHVLEYGLLDIDAILVWDQVDELTVAGRADLLPPVTIEETPVRPGHTGERYFL